MEELASFTELKDQVGRVALNVVGEQADGVWMTGGKHVNLQFSMKVAVIVGVERYGLDSDLVFGDDVVAWDLAQSAMKAKYVKYKGVEGCVP